MRREGCSQRRALARRVLLVGGVLIVAAAASLAVGFAMGGRSFVDQHKGPLLVAAAWLTALATVMVRLVMAFARGVAVSMRRPKKLDESGAAATEFVIVVIPFMLMLTALMQLALASLARTLVSYAAFSAARAASVMVPIQPAQMHGFGATVGQAFTDELQNNIGYGANTRTDFAISHKAALVRNAAAYALIPASPAIDIVVQDTIRNWDSYYQNRLKYGLDPLDYLKSLLGDLAAVPSALLRDLADQINQAIKNSVTKDDAKKKVDDWIAQHVSNPTEAQFLEQWADAYIDRNFNGSAESIPGQVGQTVKDLINETLSGPLDKFKDAVNQAVDGSLGSAGGNAPGGGVKGGSIDRALDVGFGSGTDGAGGAILRSLRKLIYARLGTVVTLHDENGNVKTRFAWNDPIRARVTYLFYCQIPLANRFAGKAFYNLPDTTVADLATGPMKALTIIGIPGYFMAMTAEHTLVNQGKPLP